jgi:hypothetical protein
VVPSGIGHGGPDFFAGIAPVPFHEFSLLKLGLEADTWVQWRILDSKGVLVEEPVAGDLKAGHYQFPLGEKLSTGIYFVELTLGERVMALRMVKQ